MKRMMMAKAIAMSFLGLWLAHEAVAQPTTGNAAPAAGIAANGVVNTPSSTGGDTQSIGPRADAAQIDRLVAIEKTLASNHANTGGAASVNTCVEHYIQAVAPNNRDWNPSDPRWEKMREVISQDCPSIIARYSNMVATFQSAYFEALASSYEKHLGSTDANTLIHFYESDAGKRYLALQAALTEASGRATSQLYDGKASHNSHASQPEAMRARMQFLRLSRPISMMIVANEDTRKAGGDSSGAPAIAIMMMVIAESQGHMLDQLKDEYSADLPKFTKFLESPPELDELRALHEAANAATDASMKVSMQLNQELNEDLNKWQQLYRSIPSDR